MSVDGKAVDGWLVGIWLVGIWQWAVALKQDGGDGSAVSLR
ncbi:hypothetical protein QT971_11730 [Microcoleus sp. herbarium19]